MSEALQHEIELNKEATKAEDKVPFMQKLAFSMGVVSDHYANVCLSIFLGAFFIDFLKIGAAMVGYAQAAARCWDAFTDPLVGTLSDRCKSKFGRRKPFVFLGAVLTGLFFPVIWMVPPEWSKAAITIYLFAALLIYYTFYSIFSVPYEALGAELTPDYKERSSVFVVRSVVQQIFNLGIIWVFPFAMFLGQKFGSEIQGVRMVGWFIAAMIIIAGIIPAVFSVERYSEIAKKSEKTSFWSGVKVLLKNKPYLLLIGTICTYLFSIMATMNLAYFVNVYYVYSGKIAAGAVLGGIDGTLRFVCSLAAAWGIKKLSDRFDKHHMLITCVWMLLISFIGIYFTTLPGRPWLTLVFKPFLAVGEVGFWVLVLSMRADVCDWDEYQTGKRNEGLIAATMNWVNKMAITLAMVVAGLLLQYVVKFNSDFSAPNKAMKAEIVAQAQVEYDAMPATEKEGLKLKDVEKQLIAAYSDGIKADVKARAEAEFLTVSEEAKAGKTAPKWYKRVATAIATPDGGKGVWSRMVEAVKNGEVAPVTVESLQKELEQKAVMEKNDAATMQRLRISYTLPQVVALICCLFFLHAYPLTHDRLAEIRAELEKRRGKTIET